MILRLLITIISIGLLQYNCNAETTLNKIEAPSKLNVQEAIDYAIKNNKQIKALSATLPVTEANLIIAKYRPNPKSTSDVIRPA